MRSANEACEIQLTGVMNDLDDPRCPEEPTKRLIVGGRVNRHPCTTKVSRRSSGYLQVETRPKFRAVPIKDIAPFTRSGLFSRLPSLALQLGEAWKSIEIRKGVTRFCKRR